MADQVGPREDDPGRPPDARTPPVRRATDLYARAQDLGVEERAAWLESECGDEPSLRDEVESLLACDADAEAFFDRLATAVRSIPAEEMAGWIAPGRRIGPYEVVDEIGRGAMGVVYRARDTRLGRLVAIKVLPPWRAAGGAARERLEAEARAASAIDHPHIGTLYDIVETDDGDLALVMAHYEGETLRERLDRGPLAGEEAARIGRQVASGLAAAHARGIVHRDVKPANLFLTEAGPVKILDFGVAEVVGEGDRGAGTVAYMAPERLRGAPSDQRADLWALGVVLHEALAGDRPFRGRTETDIARSIREDDPPRLPGPLGRVVAGLLAKDPAARYPDAETVVAELEAVESRSGSLRRFARAVALGALGAIALALAGDRMTPRQAVPAPIRVAVLPFSVRGPPDLEYLAEGLMDLLSTNLDGAGNFRPVAPRAVLARMAGRGTSGTVVSPAEAASLVADLEADQFVLGHIVEFEGRIRIRTDLYARDRLAEPLATASVEGAAQSLFHLVDELTAQLLVAGRHGPSGRLARIAAVTTSSLPALKVYLEGEGALREGRFEDALDSFQRAVVLDSLFALAHYELAQAAGWARRPGLAIEAAERAARHVDRLPPRERILVAAYLANYRGEYAEAGRLYRRVTAGYPSDVSGWQELAELNYHFNPLHGRPRADSRPYFERAVELDPGNAESLFHLMELAAWEGDTARVRALGRRLPDQALPVWRALEAFAGGTDGAREAAVAALARASEYEIFRAAEAVELARRDEGVRRIAGLLADPGRPDDWRALGRWILAEVALGEGDTAAAGRVLAALERLDREWALLSRALHAATPGVEIPESGIREIRAAVAAWEPRAREDSRNTFLAVHAGYRPAVRLYLAGLLDARLGERAAALAGARALDRMAAAGGDAERPGTPANVARGLAASVRAHQAWWRGDPRSALAHLERRVQPRGDQLWSPVLTGLQERYLRAEALRATGRHEEAAAWYASVAEHAPVGQRLRSRAERVVAGTANAARRSASAVP